MPRTIGSEYRHRVIRIDITVIQVNLDMTDHCTTDFCIWRTICLVLVRCISSICHMYTTDFAYDGPIFLVPLSLSYPSSPVSHFTHLNMRFTGFLALLMRSWFPTIIPKRGCALYTKLRPIHRFKDLDKGCVLYTGASYTREITVSASLPDVWVRLVLNQDFLEPHLLDLLVQ